jgi:hypothetical protein
LNRRFADLVLLSEDPNRLVREGPMSSFDIDITNDGGWWTVHIREITGPAQGRTISEFRPGGRAARRPAASSAPA